MAKYSVEVREIVNSGLKLFNFEYDFYDINKKADFEQKFIDHFYFREIGVETVGRFQHYLKCKCNEALPYYNMLFRTALIDYEKTINFKLTETYDRGVNKHDTLSGNTTNTETKNDTVTSSGGNTRTTNATLTGNRTDTIDQTVTHTDDNTFTHDQNKDETYTIDKTNTIDNTIKHVESDTPSGLLAMEDIENNVYASKVNIDSNASTNHDAETNETNTAELFTDTTHNSSSDTTHTTDHDVSTNTNNETIVDNNNNVITNIGSGGNTSTASQTGTGTENETSTRTTMGSYGVITEADMLQKHINLQKTLSKILVMFFDECEDLFMQIF